MITLALDTASPQAAAALVEHGRVRAELALDAGPGLPARLFPELLAFLEREGLAPRDLGLLASTTGPGSFTGLRVGLAACQGLARGLGKPLLGLDSFRLRALQVNRAPGRALRIVLDSRRAELFCATLPAGSDSAEPPQLLTVAQLAALSAGAPDTDLTGDAEALLRAGWPEGQPLPWLAPQRSAAAALGLWAASLTPVVYADHPPRAVYVREADALPAAALPWLQAEVQPLHATDTARLAAAAAVHAAAFPAHPWNAASLAGLLSQPATRGWSVMAGDRTLAVLVVSAVLDEAEILTLATAPAARRRGHAQALLAAARDALRATGVTRLHLEVAEGNTAARALYESRLGFTAIGRRKGYYLRPDGSREDALMLAVDLA